MNDDRTATGRPRRDRSGSKSAIADSVVDRDARTVLYEAVVDGASECLVVIDEANRVVFANPALEEVFGYRPEAVVGERLTVLVPPRLREAHLEAFAAYLRTGERTVNWDSLRFPGLHSEGHEVPLLLSFREFIQDDDRYFVGVMRDVTEELDHRDRLAVERAFVESMFDALPDIVYAFDTEGQFLRWNDRVEEVTGYTDAEVSDLEPLDFVPESDHDRVAAAIGRVLTDRTVETVESALVTKDGREIPYEFTGAPLVQGAELVGITGVGRDVTERKLREERLRRLNALNTVIRSVDQALIEATTRDEIEAAVPERLVSEGGYVGALLGRPEGDDGFRVDASAGVGTIGFDGLLPAGHAGAGDLAAEALETETVVVRNDLWGGAGGMPEGEAREQGYRSAAAVPIVADSRSFGVLGVYSDRADAFAEQERTILGELGHGIANAIQGALTHQLLYADTVTEIEIRATDEDVAFVTLSDAMECRLELEHALSYGDELVFYFTVTGADPPDVTAFATDHPEISRVEHLGSEGDEHRFEFVTDHGTLTEILIEHGARTAAGVAEEGVARITVEVPPDEDVRALLDSLRAAYPETELVARRDVTRSLRRPEELRRELSADLTEKQRGALEAAYFGGYFEWPSRTSSAKEVAEMLDIAPQTFHQHHRVALRKLLRALLESESGERPP